MSSEYIKHLLLYVIANEDAFIKLECLLIYWLKFLGKAINIEYGNIEKKKVTSNRC